MNKRAAQSQINREAPQIELDTFFGSFAASNFFDTLPTPSITPFSINHASRLGNANLALSHCSPSLGVDTTCEDQPADDGRVEQSKEDVTFLGTSGSRINEPIGSGSHDISIRVDQPEEEANLVAKQTNLLKANRDLNVFKAMDRIRLFQYQDYLEHDRLIDYGTDSIGVFGSINDQMFEHVAKEVFIITHRFEDLQQQQQLGTLTEQQQQISALSKYNGLIPSIEYIINNLGDLKDDDFGNKVHTNPKIPLQDKQFFSNLNQIIGQCYQILQSKFGFYSEDSSQLLDLFPSYFKHSYIEGIYLKYKQKRFLFDDFVSNWREKTDEELVDVVSYCSVSLSEYHELDKSFFIFSFLLMFFKEEFKVLFDIKTPSNRLVSSLKNLTSDPRIFSLIRLFESKKLDVGFKFTFKEFFHAFNFLLLSRREIFRIIFFLDYVIYSFFSVNGVGDKPA